MWSIIYHTERPKVALPRRLYLLVHLFNILFVQVEEVNIQLQKEKESEAQARQAARSAEQASGGGGGGKGWNEEDLQLLIKAVNLFPAGTNAR